MWTLRKALDALPPGLDETYSRILEQVNEHEQPRVRLMLQWLCFSFRPLRIEELADIFHVGGVIGPPFNADAVVFHPEDVLDVCPGLLSLTTIEVHWRRDAVWPGFKPRTSLQIAQIAHFSVKEYLLQSPHRPTWLPLNQELAHLSILKSSLAYFRSVATKLPDNTQCIKTWHELAMSHSLAIYCGRYTQNHLLSLSHGQREHPDLLESFRCLLNPHSGFTIQGCTPFDLKRRFAFEPHSESAICKDRAPAVGVSLLIAARLGLTKMVGWLLSFDGVKCTEDDDVKCDINFIYMETCYGRALAEASAEGHIDIVRLLLGDQYCARLDMNRGDALCDAVAHGHEEIVQLLINAGADVSLQSPTMLGPLHIASGWGYVNIIRILLAHGAEVNAISHGATPLQTATMWGQAKSVRMLIDAGADVNLVSGTEFGLPLLKLAVERGSVDLARILLGANAAIGPVRGDGTTALGIATACGHQDIVKLFLESGADFTRENKTAALAVARKYHHDTIADMLLAAGADPIEAEKIQREHKLGKRRKRQDDHSDSIPANTIRPRLT
jgi:ankyrin repeat protein